VQKHISILPLAIGLCILSLNSCRKKEQVATDCFPNATTYRQIADKPAAVIQAPNGLFYIIEQGTIDTKLEPCNLPAEFQVHNLLVTISGNVKSTVQGGPGPCCTEHFTITKILK
jgi:hypothetical protein